MLLFMSSSAQSRVVVDAEGIFDKSNWIGVKEKYQINVATLSRIAFQVIEYSGHWQPVSFYP